MKQIVDKLNKIAKKIDESVEIPQTDLIIDSLDAITKAYGGTPNDSNLIVDKLEDIYNNIGSGVSGNIEITENGENINVAPYATATVNVSGGGGIELYSLAITLQTTDKAAEYFFPLNQTTEFEGSLYSQTAIQTDTIFNDDDPLTVETSIIKSDNMVYNCMVRPSTGDNITVLNPVNCTVQIDSSSIFAQITGDNASFDIMVSTTTPA